MNETDVIQSARAFVARVSLTVFPIDLEACVRGANAKLKYEALGENESGTTLRRPDGVHVVIVNSLETPARRNFTVCHEIAHIVLGLPSDHREVPPWSSAKRDPNEWMCDLFAAELLMPYTLWRKALPPEELSRSLIEKMASAFECSFPAAASRYASLASHPCAYVTMSQGTVRFATMSMSLRTVGAKIRLRSPVPPGSLAHRLRADGVTGFEQGVTDQDVWFDDWEKGSEMEELSRHDAQHDSTISLLWFPDEELPEREVGRFGIQVSSDDGGLAELDGQLPWPRR